MKYRDWLSQRPFQLTFKLATLLLVAVLGASCADYVDAAVRLRLRVIVKSSEGRPVPSVKVWLKDFHPGLHKQPQVLQQPACITNEGGSCSAVIEYRFGFTSWPWRHYNSGPSRTELGYTLRDRFELTAETNGRRVPLGFLPPLTGAQVQGFEEVDFLGWLPEPVD